MADTPAVDCYPMTTSTRAEVEALAQNHLANGAISSVVTENAAGTKWVLTTVYAGGDPPDGNG
jgi:hypothetical protein